MTLATPTPGQSLSSGVWGTALTDMYNAVNDGDLIDNIPALTGPWATWVPTLANLTLGNGTMTARFQEVGQSVDWYWQFLLGSTSAVGTAPSFTLPAVPGTHYPFTNPQFPGQVHVLDTGIAERQGALKLAASGVVTMAFWNATPALATISATTPFTFGTGDYLTAWGKFERT